MGSLAESYGKQCEQINYKTMRYPGHCAQMRLLMNDLKLNQDRATLKRVLENAVPQTLQDVVIVYAAVAGKQDGELREENYVNKIYPQMIAGRLWSAIQVTTAAGITAVVDIVLSSARKYSGFVAQEQFDLPAILDNRFGQLLRPGRHEGSVVRDRGEGRSRSSTAHGRRESRRGEIGQGETQEMSTAKNAGRRRHPEATRHRFDQRRRMVGHAWLDEGHGGRRDQLRESGHRRNARAGARRHRHRLRSRDAQRGRGRDRVAQRARRRAAARRSACWATRLREAKEDLGALVTLENGKIKAEGLGEVQEMIDIADFAVGQSRMLYGNTMHSERPQHRMYEQWHPLGVVGIISAFNFPVAVWAWNAFLAAICGNASVWKPSPKTPLTAIAVQHICNKVMREHELPRDLPDLHRRRHRARHAIRRRQARRAGVVHRLHGVGRNVAERVARRLGKILLELGGNNAIIVDESADLKLAVPAIVFGAVGTAGQRCTTTRRVLVHRSRLDELEKKLAHAYTQVRIGNPIDPATLMGPLIDKGAVERYSQAIAQAKAAGGKVVTRRESPRGQGQFRRADDRPRRRTTGPSCSTRRSRRCST